MRNLFVCSILLAAATGCTPRMFNGMDFSSKENMLRDSLYPFFSGMSDSTHIFNMQISYKGNDVDGFLIVKYKEKSFARVVFTSIPGLTIFDFEVSANNFIVHRCIEPLQKKVVLNLFEKDFRTLFLYNIPTSFDAKKYQGKDNKVGYKIKTQNGTAYILTDTERKELQNIQLPGCITLLNIEYRNFENNFPRHISISHPKIKLNMQLEKAINPSSSPQND